MDALHNIQAPVRVDIEPRYAEASKYKDSLQAKRFSLLPGLREGLQTQVARHINLSNGRTFTYIVFGFYCGAKAELTKIDRRLWQTVMAMLINDLGCEAHRSPLFAAGSFAEVK